jgi:hypothetical protein
MELEVNPIALYTATYRNSDELQTDVGDGNVDSVQHRKGAQDDILA